MILNILDEGLQSFVKKTYSGLPKWCIIFMIITVISIQEWLPLYAVENEEPG